MKNKNRKQKCKSFYTLMKCLLVLSRTNSVELNKKTEIVESGIFVAEKTIAKGNDQLSKVLQESSLKRDLLQQVDSKIAVGVKRKAHFR